MDIVCLLNDANTVRERNSEGVTVLDCGCAYTNGEVQRWVQGCQKDFADFQRKREEVRRERV